MATLQDAKLYLMGNSQHEGWNKKLCFEARDVLKDCVDAQPNGNKFRCPDQLYAYEMWCPTAFRRIQSSNWRKQDLDAQMYTQEYVD